MGETNTLYISEYFASSVRKGKNAVVALMCVKNDI